MDPSDETGPSEPAGKVEIDRISDIQDATLNIAGRDVIHIDQVVIGEQASIGLKALEKLLDTSPEVREAVFASRAHLEQIKGQIDKIADYKDVHDLLHQLQYSCYNMIRREEANFPDLSALDILGSYEMNMRTILVHLRAVEARQQIHASELAWIEDVETARDLLQKAIDLASPDRGSLIKSNWYLMRIINQFPTLINNSLLREARDLDLVGLHETLQAIAPTAEGTSPDVRSVSQFMEGLNAIQEMNRRLLALTESHDSWQKLDLEFIQFEEMLETDPSFIEFSWSELISPRLNALMEGSPPMESKNLSAAREALEREIASQNGPRIKNLASILRRETGIRFFQVDVHLKALCDELRKVAQPLEGILYRIGS